MTPESIFTLQEKVATLSEALLASHPQLPILLRTIHTQLRADPELVTALSEEEIGVIVNSLSKQTQTEIVTKAVKPAATASVKKLLKSAGGSAEDLF